VVSDHLDDRNNTRWSTAQIDIGLSVALSQCLDDYISGGGDRFDTVTTITSDSNGAVDMSTLDPFAIRGISLLVGSRYFKIQPQILEDRNLDDKVIRTYQFRYCKTYALSTTASDPLIGVGATPALSWDVFDHWVCAKAAQFCSVKDSDRRPDITILERSLAGTVMTTIKVPGSQPFPSPPYVYSQLIYWVWKRDTRTLQFVRPT
jgi:hypothetical protein